MSKACIICRSSKSSTVFNEFGIDILKCNACGHIFSSYEKDQFYDGYYGPTVGIGEHFWWNEAHNQMYEEFCRRFILDKKGRLLDVGCGLGFFIKKASAYPNWRVFGYEISKAAVDFAREKLELKDVFCGKVEDSDFPTGYFDIITLWDVIEHIPYPDPLLKYLNKILKTDGFLFIHTPNAKIQLLMAKFKRLIRGMKKGIHYVEAKDHLNLYTMNTIKTVLLRNGFKRIDFIHLKPIQSISGSKNQFLRIIKNYWYYNSKILYKISSKRLNFDNLFVQASKKN